MNTTFTMEGRIRQFIKRQPWTCKCITPEMDDYILFHYTKVASDDIAGRNWLKVYRKGTDAKFGHYMVCLDTKQRRDSTLQEFYGGGAVD